jgi:hypothetical protein
MNQEETKDRRVGKSKSKNADKKHSEWACHMVSGNCGSAGSSAYGSVASCISFGWNAMISLYSSSFNSSRLNSSFSKSNEKKSGGMGAVEGSSAGSC